MVHLQLVEDAVQERLGGQGDKAIEDMTLDELEEMEDEADERILLEYRCGLIAVHWVFCVLRCTYVHTSKQGR